MKTPGPRPSTLRTWAIITLTLGRYFLYKMGLRELPTCEKYYPEFCRFIGQLLGWDRMLRNREEQRCPQDTPCVFISNHMLKDDPFILFRAVYDATRGRVCSRIMMRDDFFSSLPDLRIIDFNEITQVMGTYHISRDNVQLSQLKPFIRVLKEGLSFMMFPTRTRTRTGLFAEYRDGMDEPGGVSFFLAQAQKGKNAVRPAVVPTTRTHNFATNKTVFVFGDPIYLSPEATREEQRAFDFHLIEVLAELVEVNVPQIVSLILYLRCLHNLTVDMTIRDLEKRVAQVFDTTKGRYIDPVVDEDLAGAVYGALDFLETAGMLQIRNGMIVMDVARILSAPEPDTKYRQKNPVKYLVNELVHMGDVINAAERAAR